MGAMASQITSLTIVYSTIHSGTDERKHQSSASLAFVCGIHRWPVNCSHKWPVTQKMFPFDDVIMIFCNLSNDSACQICWYKKGIIWVNDGPVYWHIDPSRSLDGFKLFPMLTSWWPGDVHNQTSDISRTLVGNNIVDHSDVVGASPVCAAPTSSSFST